MAFIPAPVDLPDPGIKPESPALKADSLPAELLGKPNWNAKSTKKRKKKKEERGKRVGETEREKKEG